MAAYFIRSVLVCVCVCVCVCGALRSLMTVIEPKHVGAVLM